MATDTGTDTQDLLDELTLVVMRVEGLTPEEARRVHDLLVHRELPADEAGKLAAYYLEQMLRDRVARG